MKKILLRCLMLTALCIAFYNPHILRFKSTQESSILVDISESFSESDRASGLTKARALAGSDVEVKYFAGTAEDPINRGETDLAHALLSAHGKNIFLVSDGWENKGSVSSIYSTLKERGITVFPITNATNTQSSFCGISLLSTPLHAGRNTSVPATVTIQNNRFKPCSGTLIVHHGESTLFNQHVSVAEQSDARFEMQTDPKQEGLTAVKAEFHPDEGEQTQRTKYISITEREKILVISGAESDVRALKPALDSQNFKATYVVGGDADGISKDDLKTFASFILNNVAIKQLSREFLESIKTLVASGKGLVTFGGERGYGLGGYRDSVIEEVMPLESLPPQTEEKRLNAAVQLVIDKSQSMANESRLDFVKSAAKEVINGLKPDDYLGVVAFDSQPFVVVPIGRLQEIRQTALSQIENIFPTGSTRLMRALQDASRLIERVPAGRKHIIVLTDGRLPDAGPMYLELVKQLRISGITLSTVLLSDDGGSYPLKEMAELGGGVFYVTTDPTKLPRIFMEDIRVSGGEKTMKESEEYKIKRGPAGIISTKLSLFPTIKGYVQTKAKPTADVELLVDTQAAIDPLLASWNFQQGKVISYTSDIYGRWSASWITWDKFSQFILDIITASSSALRRDESLQFDIRPIIEGDQLHLDLSIFSDVTDKGSIKGVVTKPDGSKESILFHQRASGSFTSELSSLRGGDYTLEMQAGSKNFPPIKFNVTSDVLGEKVGMGYNLPLLSELASVTKGALNPENSSLHPEETFEPYSLQKWFALLALVLLFADIWVRER